MLNPTAIVTLNQSKAHLQLDHAVSDHIEAEFVGLGNGTNKVFTLDNTPLTGTLRLYVNGAEKAEGTDYTRAGAVCTFVTAPGLNLPVTAAYDKASSESFDSYDDDLLATFINTATTLAEEYSGFAFIERKVTEERVGDGFKYLHLYKAPAQEVTSVKMDGDALTKDTDYSEALVRNSLYRGGGWDKDSDIEVEYTAGNGETLEEAQATANGQVGMTAVLVAVSVWWDNRQASDAPILGLPDVSKRLLDGIKGSLV